MLVFRCPPPARPPTLWCLFQQECHGLFLSLATIGLLIIKAPSLPPPTPDVSVVSCLLYFRVAARARGVKACGFAAVRACVKWVLSVWRAFDAQDARGGGGGEGVTAGHGRRVAPCRAVFFYVCIRVLCLFFLFFGASSSALKLLCLVVSSLFNR